MRWAVLKYFIGLKDIATLKRDKCRRQVDRSAVEFRQEEHRIESFEIFQDTRVHSFVLLAARKK